MTGLPCGEEIVMIC